MYYGKHDCIQHHLTLLITCEIEPATAANNNRHTLHVNCNDNVKSKNYQVSNTGMVCYLCERRTFSAFNSTLYNACCFAYRVSQFCEQ